MASWLIDTNIVLAVDNPKSPHRNASVNAIVKLKAKGDTIYICPQVCTEFWNIATRPEPRGLSMTSQQASKAIKDLKNIYSWLDELPGLFDDWLKLCVATKTTGAKCYDGRIAALMISHGLTNILTFNTKDYPNFPNISAVDPSTI